MDATKKTVAIVGAGASGLTACNQPSTRWIAFAAKHALAKGFRPVVFEADDGIGGVWRHTLASTSLQTPAFSYRFSDFPWPPEVAEVFPRHDQVVEYLAAYARRYGVLECVRFGRKVIAVEYAGAPAEQAAAWELWPANGETFGDGSGQWLLTVQHRGSEATQICRFDFLILSALGDSVEFPTPRHFHPIEVPRCSMARCSTPWTTPTWTTRPPPGRGKRVAVVGSGKSAFDTAAECAAANGARYPCAMICRSGRWMVNGGFVWGVSLGHLFTNRLAELMVRKPGEGLALTLLAMLLTPLVATVEADRDVLQDADPDGEARDGAGGELRGINVGLPARSSPRQVLRQGGGGQHLDQEDQILRLLNGRLGARRHRRAVRRGRRRARHRLPWRREAEEHVRLGNVQADGRRQIIHPRIPQMAVIGYTESLTSIYTYEMMAKWVAHLLAGAFRRMEASASEWGEHAVVKKRGGGRVEAPCFGAVSTWYNDELCRDMGYEPRRKQAILAEWLKPHGSADYAAIR
uniref:Flavin-containing monooxygenase n=2 Tax=Oryza brachyantha TaxID=4533 RepID=J3MC59_ORYBR